MKRLPFDPDFEDLPGAIPIFPLPGVLLLPGGKLPLNIFEPRYLAMTRAALAGSQLIGMVQPRPLVEEGGDFGMAPVYDTGCAGRITAFSETEDGRYLITLSGIIRFDIIEELPIQQGFRQVRADWSRYRADLDVAHEAFDRARLLNALNSYFDAAGISGDWDAINATPNETLVTSLAMICPFEPSEKQALLEAPSLRERAETMIAILELAVLEGEHDLPRH